MNPIKPIAVALASAGALYTVQLQAADIDLYAGADGGSSAPNVLFFIDNSSNWAANNQAWEKAPVYARCATKPEPARTACQNYTNQIFGTNTKLFQGQVEARALKLVLNELVCGPSAKLKINAGVMLFNDQGSVDSNSWNAGYIRHRIAPMDATHCTTLLNDLTAIDADINAPQFKAPSSASYGLALYEAFKYFGGWTNPAGATAATAGTPQSATGFGPIRYSKKINYEDPQAFTDPTLRTTYKSPIDGDSICGNNYIVLIGNTFPNQENDVNTNSNPHPTSTIMTRLGYNAGAQIYPKPLLNSDKSDVRFADEWAKFLYDTDVSQVDGVQNVQMFTIDVYNPDGSFSASSRAAQAKLLQSIAEQSGPDGYFPVGGDLYSLVMAFTDILTKVAAVNSVFTSASLPVSVNAQGTFLNQVFMGVFRPDENAQQRWAGNLKQYQFALTNSGTLFLADKNKASAVDAVNTGFINQCATSFWTTDSNTYWETLTGMNGQHGCSTPEALLKLYSDAPDGPLVERGGAGQRLRQLGHAARNMRTCDTASCSGTNLVNFPNATMSASNSTLANWLRGTNNGDGYLNASTGVVTYSSYGLAATATRPTVHGAVVHSRPLAVNYGTNNANDVVVFYGSGDGTLRAVNGNQADTDGNELWAFVAPEHFSALDRVRTNSPLIAYPNVSPTLTPTPTPKTYFFDGSIGGYQERTLGSVDKLWIYPSMRRGGRGVYAFNVTNKPGTGVNQPTLMWRFNESNDARMGESWSTPTAIRVKGMSGPQVVFGAGYHTCEDDDVSPTACNAVTQGKGIVILDAQHGPTASADAKLNRFIGVAAGELDSSAGRFVADITPVDVNGDGYVDLLYAVDTRGNVWRINTSDPSDSYSSYKAGGVGDASAWKVTKIAQVGLWGAADSVTERRKFMYSPSVVTLGNQTTVLVGTGDREKPLSTNNSTKVNNRFYALRDNFTDTTDVDVIVGYGGAVGSTDDLAELKNVTNASNIDPTALSAYKGWFINLSVSMAIADPDNPPPLEQVVTTPLTIGGITYFNTYQAKSTGSNVCTNLGTGRSYQVNFQTGTPPKDQPLTTTFVAGGIPPSPVGGLVVVDGKTVPFIIGGPGPTPISPKKVPPVVKPDRKPIYRYIRID